MNSGDGPKQSAERSQNGLSTSRELKSRGSDSLGLHDYKQTRAATIESK